LVNEGCIVIRECKGTAAPRVQQIAEEWARLIEYCQRLGYGEIEKLRIHNGVPVIADVVREKVKFN